MISTQMQKKISCISESRDLKKDVFFFSNLVIEATCALGSISQARSISQEKSENNTMWQFFSKLNTKQTFNFF